MKASEKNWELARRFWARGINQIERGDCAILRRAELTLHRWHEQECGIDNGNGGTVVISRGDEDGKPYRSIHGRLGHICTYPVSDLEAGAIRRVEDVCKSLGLYYYVQTDPRGAALFVSDSPISDNNYSGAICCCVR